MDTVRLPDGTPARHALRAIYSECVDRVREMTDDYETPAEELVSQDRLDALIEDVRRTSQVGGPALPWDGPERRTHAIRVDGERRLRRSGRHFTQ